MGAAMPDTEYTPPPPPTLNTNWNSCAGFVTSGTKAATGWRMNGTKYVVLRELEGPVLYLKRVRVWSVFLLQLCMFEFWRYWFVPAVPRHQFPRSTPYS